MNGKENSQIARIDERVKAMHQDIKEIKTDLKSIKETSLKKQAVFMERFGKIENKIYMASGGLSALTIIALTKALGLW